MFSPNETLKLLKEDLKRAFPNQEFDVFYKRFPDCYWLIICWKNGVAKSKVQEITRKYQGSCYKVYDIDYVYRVVYNREVDKEIYDQKAREAGFKNFDEIADYKIGAMIREEIENEDL